MWQMRLKLCWEKGRMAEHMLMYVIAIESEREKLERSSLAATQTDGLKVHSTNFTSQLSGQMDYYSAWKNRCGRLTGMDGLIKYTIKQHYGMFRNLFLPTLRYIAVKQNFKEDTIKSIKKAIKNIKRWQNAIACLWMLFHLCCSFNIISSASYVKDSSFNFILTRLRVEAKKFSRGSTLIHNISNAGRNNYKLMKN